MLTPFKKNKSLTFLISLMLLMLVYPFFELSRVGSVIYTFLFTAALLSGVYAISFEARTIAVGILLVTPILICHWSNFILNIPAIETVQRICTTVFMIYILTTLLHRILNKAKVGLNEIYGAISAYTLIGIVFGFFYMFIETMAPGSFALHGSRPDVATFVYYSFVALSTCGFGDITAAAPFARAVTVIEIITGVTYVAVLIGRLISASQMGGGKEDHAETAERHENQKEVSAMLHSALPLEKNPLGLVAACVMLNYVTSAVVIQLKIPFFLDSWGTSLAVILGGWAPGVITALIYHFIISWLHWGWDAWIWTFSSLLIAAATYFFYKEQWIRIDRPYRLLLAGVGTGFLNGLLVQFLIYFSKMPPYQGTLPVYRFFLKVTSNQTFAALSEKMFVEVADKTISFMIAACAVYLLQDFLTGYKKSLETKDHKNSHG